MCLFGEVHEFHDWDLFNQQLILQMVATIIERFTAITPANLHMSGLILSVVSEAIEEKDALCHNCSSVVRK